MTNKYSFQGKRRFIIIYILSFIILIFAMLYIAERNKYSNEKEEVDKVSMYLYGSVVESPLRGLLNYVGIRPVESVDWEEQQFREELSSLFHDINFGIATINGPEMEAIPENTQALLQTLQEKIKSIQEIIHIEKQLEQQTKEEIMNFSEAIDSCKVDELNRSWEQIESEIECLIKSEHVIHSKK